MNHGDGIGHESDMHFKIYSAKALIDVLRKELGNAFLKFRVIFHAFHVKEVSWFKRV